ncbi:MAG: hypothetical protein ACKVT0_08375 [Planctomycetaceae bacterium]
MSVGLTVTCPECATKLRLKDRKAVGKRIKCPKCEVPFLVELTDAASDDPLDFLDDLESQQPARRRRDDDEADEESAPRPKKKTSAKKKKKRKSTAWQQPALIGGGILLLVLLLGGGVYLSSGMFKSSNKVDMSYLPPDGDILVKVNVAEVAQSQILSPLMNHDKVKAAMTELTQKLGYGLNDIDSITLGIKSTDGSNMGGFPGMPLGASVMMNSTTPAGLANFEGVAVVRFAKSIDAKTLVAAVPNTELLQHNGRDMIRSPLEPGQSIQMAGILVDGTTLIIGSEPSVKAAYDRGPQQTRRPEFDFINPNMQIVYAYVPKDRQVFKNMAAMQPTPQGADKHIMEFTIGTGGGMDFRSDIDIETWHSLESRSAAASALRGVAAEKANAKEQLTQARNMIQQQGGMMAMMAPGMNQGFSKLLDIADQTVDSLRGSKSGSYYTMQLTVPGSIGPAVQELIASMPDTGGLGGFGMPGSGGMPGGFPTAPPSAGAYPPGAFPGQPPAGFPPGISPGALPAAPPVPGAVPPGAFPAAPAVPGTVPPAAAPPAGFPGKAVPP